jgi:hypothetical protein
MLLMHEVPDSHRFLGRFMGHVGPGPFDLCARIRSTEVPIELRVGLQSVTVATHVSIVISVLDMWLSVIRKVSMVT